MLETFSTFLDNHQKILQKIMFHDFWSVENYFRSIECYFRLIDQELSNDRDIHKLRDYFLIIFNRLSQRFDRSKMLYFEFSLRKFQNLNFNFMKQYSSNSNIIIITYSCIYLYMQHKSHVNLCLCCFCFVFVFVFFFFSPWSQDSVQLLPYYAPVTNTSPLSTNYQQPITNSLSLRIFCSFFWKPILRLLVCGKGIVGFSVTEHFESLTWE